MLQEKRLSAESALSGGSVPSASTASEGEPEILPTEVQGLGQHEAMPGPEEYTEEDYNEVRADRKRACGAEGLSRVGSARPICLPELCDWGHVNYWLSNNEILKGFFLRQFCEVQYRAVVLGVPGKEVPG